MKHTASFSRFHRFLCCALSSLLVLCLILQASAATVPIRPAAQEEEEKEGLVHSAAPTPAAVQPVDLPAVFTDLAPVKTYEPKEDTFPFIIRYGSRDENKIALSMDDCYDMDCIQETLDICKEYGIVMTFYPLGVVLDEKDRDLWRSIVDAGCEIGTHTMRHSRLGLNENKVMYACILRPQEVLDRVLGYHYPIRTLRPPYGNIDDENGSTAKAMRMLKKAGYDHVVNWDVSQTDPVKALPRVQNGSILLYHARPADVRCIRTLVPQLLEKGFEFVTVAEIIGLDPNVTTSTDLYTLDMSLY